MYFKQGQCDRGAKCKFSHDLNVGRKVEKKDLYTDNRAEGKFFDSKLSICSNINGLHAFRYYGNLGSKEA